MLSWDDLKYILALSRHPRMNAAAQSLGINVATMSRRIERLHDLLGQPPFVRTGEGWIPSAAIDGLVQLAEDIDQRLDRELNNIRSGTTGHSTRLTIGCPPFVSQYILYPNLGLKSPALDNVSLNFTHRISAEGLGDNDVVIASKRPDSGRVVARRLGRLGIGLYSSRNPAPEQEWVSLTEAFDDAPVICECRQILCKPPRMRVETFGDLANVLAATGLVGPLVDVIGRADPRLVRTRHPPLSETVDLWILYHVSRRGDLVLQETVRWIDSCVRAAT